MDKLIVNGLGRLDGEYEFDLLDMVIVGAPGCFTVAEYRRIKKYCGVRRGEILDAIESDDAEFEIVLAAIIITRERPTVVVAEGLLEQPDALRWQFAERKAEQDPPPSPAATPEADEPSSTNGGKSSSPQSAKLASVPSPTGTRGSAIPISVQASGPAT